MTQTEVDSLISYGYDYLTEIGENSYKRYIGGESVRDYVLKGKMIYRLIRALERFDQLTTQEQREVSSCLMKNIELEDVPLVPIFSPIRPAQVRIKYVDDDVVIYKSYDYSTTTIGAETDLTTWAGNTAISSVGEITVGTWSADNLGADQINQDSTHRFITDTERTNWQAAYDNYIDGGSNVGTGAGIYKDVSSRKIRFKSLTNTDNFISFVENANDVELQFNEGGISHDNLLGFVANEHIDHSGVSILAGEGLAGGGNLTTNRTLSLSHLGFENLTDPNAQRYVRWDNTGKTLEWADLTGVDQDLQDVTDNGSTTTHSITANNFISTGATGTGSSSIRTFLQLSDTPSAYGGSALKGVRVNSGGTGLEFADISDPDAILDSDFSSNGLMKRTGAGTYSTVTDNSTNWDTAYANRWYKSGSHLYFDTGSVGINYTPDGTYELELKGTMAIRNSSTPTTLVELNTASSGELQSDSDVEAPNFISTGATGAGGGAISTFLQLTDTPASYGGKTLQVVRVNAGETALEFADVSYTETDPVFVAHVAYGITSGDITNWNNAYNGSWTPSSGNVYRATGDVYIGSSTGDYKFHVYGADAGFENTASNIIVYIKAPDTNNAVLRYYSGTDYWTTRFDGATNNYNFRYNGSTVATLDQTGNLGIKLIPSGTYALEVGGDGEMDNLTLSGNISGTNAEFSAIDITGIATLRVLYSNSSGFITASDITHTELMHLDGVTTDLKDAAYETNANTFTQVQTISTTAQAAALYITAPSTYEASLYLTSGTDEWDIKTDSDNPTYAGDLRFQHNSLNRQVFYKDGNTWLRGAVAVGADGSGPSTMRLYVYENVSNAHLARFEGTGGDYLDIFDYGIEMYRNPSYIRNTFAGASIHFSAKNSGGTQRTMYTIDPSSGSHTWYDEAANTTMTLSTAALLTVTNLNVSGVTSSRALFLSGGTLSASATTSAELGYLSGVLSPIQAQLDGKFDDTGGTVTGDITLDQTGQQLWFKAYNNATSAYSTTGIGFYTPNATNAPTYQLRVETSGTGDNPQMLFRRYEGGSYVEYGQLAVNNDWRFCSGASGLSRGHVVIYTDSGATYGNLKFYDGTNTAILRLPGGDYGTIQVGGYAKDGNWYGYSIRGKGVFMENGSYAGIYNDVNNHWLMRGTYNGATDLYYQGGSKLTTASGGVNVTGALTATGEVTAYSDISIKSHIYDYDNALDKALKLRPVYYHNKLTHSSSLGFIAQEVEEVEPLLVGFNPSDNLKTMNYQKATVIAIGAIKEQQEIIEKQDSMIVKLERRIKQLEDGKDRN